MRIAVIAAGFTPQRLTVCVARWRRFAKAALSTNLACGLLKVWWRAATHRILPSGVSARLKGLANMAFPKAMPPALPCSFTCRHGSNVIIPPLFVRR